MRVVLLSGLLLSLAFAGCLEPHTFPRCSGDGAVWEDDGTAVICVDHRLRTFLFTIPDGDGPFPLLLALHGGAGDADNMQRKTHLDEWARNSSFVLLVPDGTPAVKGSSLRTWNAVHCCGRAYQDGTDDVAFLDALIQATRDRVAIDADRIGVTGHSNGAMMAHRYGAERSGIVCCIMPVSGTIGGATPPDGPVLVPPVPDGPVDVLIIHADDDPRVPYDGGEGENLGEQRYDLSVAESQTFWEDAGGTVQVVTTHGGHGWPGGEADLATAPDHPDASRLAVDFLLDR